MIASRYSFGKSTVGDINKNKLKITTFVSRTERGPGDRITLKQPENPPVGNAVFMWFIQQRRLHVPISGEMNCEKAGQFYQQIKSGSICFYASHGWLQNFKKRHGIKRLKITGEKLSSNADSVEPFQKTFDEMVHENQFVPEQIYNADESGCFGACCSNKH